jgi:hypothetical protein
MDSFLDELRGEFPGNVPINPPTQNTYADSLALYNQSRELSTEALRMQTGVDSIYKNARPEVKRSVFQDALNNAMDFFKQYPTYKPVGQKSVRAGDRSMNIPVYAKPKGNEMTDVFLEGLKSEHPLE